METIIIWLKNKVLSDDYKNDFDNIKREHAVFGQ